MLSALTTIFLFQLIGEIIVLVFNLPIPGPVIGMVLLFLGLIRQGTLPENLKTTAHGLLKQLGLLFVPAGSGIIAYTALLQKEWLPIAVTLIISTLLTIGATALIMQGVVKFSASRKERA
jgi:holin-like protein